MDPDAAVLARCVGDVDVFAREVWGRRPLVHRGAGSFSDLLEGERQDFDGTGLGVALDRYGYRWLRLVREGQRATP